MDIHAFRAAVRHIDILLDENPEADPSLPPLSERIMELRQALVTLIPAKHIPPNQKNAAMLFDDLIHSRGRFVRGGRFALVAGACDGTPTHMICHVVPEADGSACISALFVQVNESMVLQGPLGDVMNLKTPVGT